MLGPEGALLLRVQLVQGAFARNGLLHVPGLQLTLERPRADVAAGHGVHLDPEEVGGALVIRQVAGVDGPQLHDRVVGSSLAPPGPGHQAGAIERQFRRVEEEDLAQVGVERVHAEGDDGRAPILIRHSQLQLDAVGALNQPDQLAKLLVGQGWGVGTGGHGRTS